jgi:hypothetical protein
MDPMELLKMINGKVVPTKAVLSDWRRSWAVTCPTFRSWLLKSNRDTGQNKTGKDPTLPRSHHPHPIPPGHPTLTSDHNRRSEKTGSVPKLASVVMAAASAAIAASSVTLLRWC